MADCDDQPSATVADDGDDGGPAATLLPTEDGAAAGAQSGGGVVDVARDLPDDACVRAAERFGTPLYLYSAAALAARADEALAFPAPFGLTVRFAMKALPNASVVQLLVARGLEIDASSCYEAARAIAAGVHPSQICISSQELPQLLLEELIGYGVQVNACSLRQLDRIGRAFPGTAFGVRFNPGVGSGAVGRTNVGGPDASFGVWHEFADEVKRVAAKHKLKIVRIHTHIGSGSDPEVWTRVSRMSVDLCRQFPDVTTLNLGGGYKVARVPEEKATSLQVIGKAVSQTLRDFAEETGRRLWLEIEPGTFLVASAGALVSSVDDVISTGESGRKFIKLNAGMSEMLRPQMYGSQHNMRLIKRAEGHGDEDVAEEAEGEGGEETGHSYVVVGHCCESGDIFTPQNHEPEIVAERRFPSAAASGDVFVVEHAGAYCASMAAKGYNSYPESPEVLLDSSGELHLIRERQPAEQLWENEVPLPDGVI